MKRSERRTQSRRLPLVLRVVVVAEQFVALDDADIADAGLAQNLVRRFRPVCPDWIGVRLCRA